MPSKRRAPRRRPRRKVVMETKTAKYRLANKVELIRPLNLKPVSVMKKFIFYNTAEIKNDTAVGGGQQTQFVQHYLNSPWLSSSETYARPGTATWRWNKPMTQHTDSTSATLGTSLPGCFDNPSSIGWRYQNICVVGAKFKVTATPIVDANVGPKAVAALFAQVNAQGSQLDTGSRIDDLYEMPYTQIRKIEGGGSNNGDLSGNTKSASIVIKYSPKKMNGLANIKDSSKMSATNNVVANTAFHPSEKDRIVFGIVPVLTNPTTALPMVKCILQVKHEVTVLFSEPFSNYNRAPVEITHDVASQTELATGGFMV